MRSRVYRLDRVTVSVDLRALRVAQNFARMIGVAVTELVDALIWSVADAAPMERLLGDIERTSGEQPVAAKPSRRRRRPADVIPIDRQRGGQPKTEPALDKPKLAALREQAGAACERAEAARMRAAIACEAAHRARAHADDALHQAASLIDVKATVPAV